ANRERAAAVKNLNDLQLAIGDLRHLGNLLDNDQIFHLRHAKLRRELVEPGLRDNEEVLRRHADDVTRQAEVVRAAYRVTLLRRYAGDRPQALEDGLRALELQERFVDANPDATQYRRDLAACLHNVGFLLHGNSRSAEALP